MISAGIEFPVDFSPPKEAEITEYETVINWCHNGVFYIYAKPDIRHHEEDAIRQVAFMEKMKDKWDGRLIIDIRKAPLLSLEARNYYGSIEGQKWVKMTCLITKSPVNRFIGNVYFSFINKKVKTRIENSVSKGLDWLERA